MGLLEGNRAVMLENPYIQGFSLVSPMFPTPQNQAI